MRIACIERKVPFLPILVYFFVFCLFRFLMCTCVCNWSGLPAQTSYRYFKLKNQLLSRRLTCLATFEAPSSSTELEADIELEKFDLDYQENSSKSSLSAFSGSSDGKPGFISFHGYHYLRNEVETISVEGRSRVLWFAAPTVLVVFLVFPLFYLRKILSTFFEDSLFTGILSCIIVMLNLLYLQSFWYTLIKVRV